MEGTQKKILMLIFLIISIIAFFIMIGLMPPFVRYVLQMPMGAYIFHNSVFFLSTFIFTVALWFPLVNGIGVRKACIVCIPFLLISALLYFTISTFILFLISGVILGIGSSGTLYLICFIFVYNENKKRIISCGIALIPSLLLLIILSQLSFLGMITPLYTPSYNPDHAVQTPLVILEIRLSLMIFPIIALVLVIIIMLIEKDVEKQYQIY